MPKQESSERRDAILAAAREVFRTQGYAGARIADIAREAGVAPGTVYLYFTSKDAMVWALADAYVSRITERVQAAMQRPDLHAAIADAVHAALQQAKDERDLLRLFNLSSGLGQCGDLLPADQQLLEIMTRYLSEKMERGEIRRRPPRALAGLIRAMVECVSDLSSEVDPAEAQENEQAVVEILYNALRPLDDQAPGE